MAVLALTLLMNGSRVSIERGITASLPSAIGYVDHSETEYHSFFNSPKGFDIKLRSWLSYEALILPSNTPSIYSQHKVEGNTVKGLLRIRG